MNKDPGESLKEKIQQAENSVAGMQDENLKRIAFETVLASLLGNHRPESSSATTQRKSVRKKRASGKTGEGKIRLQQDRTSTVKLNVGQLEELKKFYDDKAPAGTEEVVFTLAYFIHENLKQEKFHAGDIHRIYQNLLPLKPTTKPPAMSIEEIKRAVRWLVAPSRRKQWLNDAGDGMFEISPQGMLRVTYESREKKLHVEQS